jgi:hypothetical protein
LQRGDDSGQFLGQIGQVPATCAEELSLPVSEELPDEAPSDGEEPAAAEAEPVALAVLAPPSAEEPASEPMEAASAAVACPSAPASEASPANDTAIVGAGCADAVDCADAADALAAAPLNRLVAFTA